MDNNTQRVLSKKELKQKGEKIVAKKTVGEDTEIIVYKNGDVFYRSGKRYTVFSFPEKKSYSYGFVSGSSEIDAEVFENEEWCIRLVMEGEDRLVENQRRLDSVHSVCSYSLKGEDESLDLENTSPGVLDLMVMEETMEEIRELMTDKQREAMHHYFFRKVTQEEAARQMGISQATFGRLLKKCLIEIREKTGMEMTDLSDC